jgi:hypothetical protein
VNLPRASRPNEIGRGYTVVQSFAFDAPCRKAAVAGRHARLSWKLPVFLQSALIKFTWDEDDFKLPAMWAG